MQQIIYLHPMGEFPSQWEDLVDNSRRTIVTVYTVENAKQDGLGIGIRKQEDGVYDIVIDAPELTAERVSSSLKDLSMIAGLEYRLHV